MCIRDSDIPYDDYVAYTVDQQITADATYDNDNNDVEDDGVRIESETHTAAETINGTVITMEEWATRWAAYQTALEDNPEADPADYNVKGNFWVWDADGWAYWANPIEPGTATGLLLDGIELDVYKRQNWVLSTSTRRVNVVMEVIGVLRSWANPDKSSRRCSNSLARDSVFCATSSCKFLFKWRFSRIISRFFKAMRAAKHRIRIYVPHSSNQPV